MSRGGIIRRGAKLLYGYYNATVPRGSLSLREASIMMEAHSIGADLAFAWPGNEIAVMGAEGAANVTFRREISNAANSEAVRQQKIKQYRTQLMHPYYAAERETGVRLAGGVRHALLSPAGAADRSGAGLGHRAPKREATAVRQAAKERA